MGECSTTCLGGDRSILLSYGHILSFRDSVRLLMIRIRYALRYWGTYKIPGLRIDTGFILPRLLGDVNVKMSQRPREDDMAIVFPVGKRRCRATEYMPQRALA